MEDLIIKLIEKLKEKPNGFTYNEIISLLNLNDEEKEIVKNFIYKAVDNAKHSMGGKVMKDTIFQIHERNIPGANDEHFLSDSFKYFLKIEHIFDYLDYVELIEARKAARIANRNSIIAISIALVTMLLSIGFSVLSIYTPVKIDNEQIDLLREESTLFKEDLKF